MLQVAVNALASASIYCLVGVGLGIAYLPSRFFNFSCGMVLVSAAYSAYTLHICLDLAPAPAVFGAIVVSTTLGSCLEAFVYRPLRAKGGSAKVLLLASLGVYIVLQNLIAIVLGNETRAISSRLVTQGVCFFGSRVMPIQIVTFCVSVITVTALALLLKKTRTGKAIRAVADDPVLSQLSGVQSNRVVLCASAIGSAIMGIAGILIAFDVDMAPTMGLRPLMMGIVVFIVGGGRNLLGIAGAALLLGSGLHFGGWLIGSEWQDAIAFSILLAFLLTRPMGITKERLRKAIT